eukprot:TRINITY_DN22715_c0_g1_i3.p1 TRINITY_DN22715_c0_g1~~TRINITY_DN22715_c0_g1_i3.p1  ORF type:complete len:202 (+),score=43.53 TRINITY_DN22715_c0_g1_i3:160-765(+)
MGPKQCEVCKDAQSKYKCPSCLIPYCSLACFKKHKEIPCTKSLPSNGESLKSSATPPPVVLSESSFQVDEQNQVLQKVQLQSIAPVVLPERSFQVDERRQVLQKVQLESIAATWCPERSSQVDEYSQVLQKAQLASIASSNEIQDALKNEELQKLIYKIDSSPDAKTELDKVMQQQIFHAFADKILSVINQEEQEAIANKR